MTHLSQYLMGSPLVGKATFVHFVTLNSMVSKAFLWILLDTQPPNMEASPSLACWIRIPKQWIHKLHFPVLILSYHAPLGRLQSRCWCDPPFLCPLKISSKRTPNLKTSGFNERTPSIANSGAMYPTVPTTLLVLTSHSSHSKFFPCQSVIPLDSCYCPTTLTLWAMWFLWMTSSR